MPRWGLGPAGLVDRRDDRDRGRRRRPLRAGSPLDRAHGRGLCRDAEHDRVRHPRRTRRCLRIERALHPCSSRSRPSWSLSRSPAGKCARRARPQEFVGPHDDRASSTACSWCAWVCRSPARCSGAPAPSASSRPEHVPSHAAREAAPSRRARRRHARCRWRSRAASSCGASPPCLLQCAKQPLLRRSSHRRWRSAPG